MPPEPTLSVILITRNEAHNLEDCLQSVRALAGEIVIVDSASTDRTLDIARRYGALLASPSDWPGFGPQKNRALDLATGKWVLSIDADERVPDDLAREIAAVLAADAPDLAYKMPRLSWYCGRFIRHSGWRPDYVVRLFRRGQARFSTIWCMSSCCLLCRSRRCVTRCCITVTWTFRRYCAKPMLIRPLRRSRPSPMANAPVWVKHWGMVFGPLCVLT